jgi:hypothetical protein
LAEADKEPTQGDDIDRSGTRRPLAGPQPRHILDVELNKLVAKEAR